MILTYFFIFEIFSEIRADFPNFNTLYPQIEQLIEDSKLYKSPLNNNEYWTATEQTVDEILNNGTFDFIIVGGGTAGGVLANRLTEENFTVLLIEAGNTAPETSAVIGLCEYFFQSKWDWGYNTTYQENACLTNADNRCTYPRGKVLGGSSSTNVGAYTRGNAKDYDEWENLGNPGWSYQDVLPYFKKSEFANFSENIDKNYHGFEGLQSIAVENDTSGYAQFYANALTELEQKNIDYNGKTQIGYGMFQNYLSYNIRSSSDYSFIQPAINRQNLFITTKSLVTKIDFFHKTAVGVQFIRNGQKYYANASKEILLSAGSINTPQILMLSGIGPANHLNDLGINVIEDLPVGQNLADHVTVSLTFKYQPKETTAYSEPSIEEATKLWMDNKRPLNVGFRMQVVSFWSTLGNNNSRPDIELICRGPMVDNGEVTGEIQTVHLHPYSTGNVTLASNNPKDFPLINPNFLSKAEDLEVLYKGIKITLNILNTKTFKTGDVNSTIKPIEQCDKFEKESKEWWFCFIKLNSGTMFHPIGTTRMGNNTKTSVVDSELKVHGIKKLRVVDAGVVPSTISGHTNAAIVMIAEKIADIIKQNYL